MNEEKENRRWTCLPNRQATMDDDAFRFGTLTQQVKGRLRVRRPAYLVSSFFAASHSKLILTSSPVERMPTRVGGWMPKLVILTAVEPVNLSLSLPTRVIETGIWILLVTPATVSSPLLSNTTGASALLGASLSVISVSRYSMRGWSFCLICSYMTVSIRVLSLFNWRAGMETTQRALTFPGAGWSRLKLESNST